MAEIATTVFLLLVVGCAMKDRVQLENPEPPSSFSQVGEAEWADRWWTEFHDSQLDLQVEVALGRNFPLDGARHRMEAARELARIEGAELSLQLDGGAELGSAFNTNGPNVNGLATGLNASIPVDLWGEIRSRVDAQWLRASAAQADRDVIALVLAADVSVTWMSLIEAHAQAALLKEQLETNSTGLKLQEARFGLGQIRSADVLRQRQLVEGTRQQAIAVTARIEILEHQLAVLQGLPPQEAVFDPGDQLPDLPPIPYTGLPAQLLNRRPDIQRDYLALWAADQDWASAVSRQYPRLDLVASLQTTAESPEDLFRDWSGALAGQLLAPLLNGGRLRADVRRNEAIVRERFTDFSQTVLLAYRDVENALVTEQYQIQQIEQLELQAELAHQSSLQLREQYLIGDVEYLDVLSSITQEQSLRRQTLSARLDLITNRIALYLALAGGFDDIERCPELIDIVPDAKQREHSPPEVFLISHPSARDE